jgi:hypothetical protein
VIFWANFLVVGRFFYKKHLVTLEQTTAAAVEAGEGDFIFKDLKT